MRRLRVMMLILVFLALPLASLAQVLETFPPQGSYQTAPCGPFGVRVVPGTINQADADLVVRGSATGRRTRGLWHLSAAGDSLLFTPAIPFAPGEEVTLTVLGNPGYSWQTTIRPDDEHLGDSLGALQSDSIDLSGAFGAGELEHVSWVWTDLNNDRDQEGVLLVASGGQHHLATVTRGLNGWSVRAPAVCTADNPLQIESIDLDGNNRQDLALLSLSGLQLWANPGDEYSPNGAMANQISFPAGFHSRAMVCGDIDGDGDDDLVIFGLFGLEYLTMINDGLGQMQPQVVRGVGEAQPADKNLPWPIHALLKDADGDGRPDLIWAAEYEEQGAYRIRLAAGRGDGTFDDAGVLSEDSEFSNGLVFGRLIDPWDDSGTGPVVATATSDNGGDNFCGFTFNGGWPTAIAGCLDAAGLSSSCTPVQAAHLLNLYPELWYADRETGQLTVVTLDASQNTETVQLAANPAALGLGDFDFDGDGDVALFAADEKRILLLNTPGGTPNTAPTSDGVQCGGVMDFGVREVNCADDAVAAFLPFTNDGLLPARITSVDLDDLTGFFSLQSIPETWFSGGCLGPAATVMLPINYAPADTMEHNANLTVTLNWVGAAAAGGDSTMVCEFLLKGRGGIHRVDDFGSGLGALVWSSAAGYQSQGAEVNFGTLPALSEITTGAAVSLTNTGHFPVLVAPPTILAEPFTIIPAGSIPLAPGQTQEWTVQLQPDAELIPAGADSVDLLISAQWTVSSLSLLNCLPDQILNQDLSVRLLAAAPCLAPDPECSGLAEICADVDTVYVVEDGTFSYCLDQAGWTWPAATPELRVVENPMPWLQVQELPLESGLWPIVELSSSVIGAEGGDILLELRDNNFPTVVRDFTLTVVVEPSRPDLAIVDMLFLPMIEDGEIQQQHPFIVDVVVEVTREEVQGAVMELNGGWCTCDVGTLDKVLINLVEDRRDTIRFVVESCGESGDCSFTACIEPAEGMDADFDPDNNCFTLGTAVAANRSPSIEIFNLVLTPDDPTLEPCQSGITLNEISDGMVQAFGVREENNLSFDVRSRDSDGDDTRLTVGLLPPFVSATAVGDTLVQFDITPPEGTVTREVCEEFGPLVFQVIETSSALPETALVEIPLYVKWIGPDLEATLTNVPTSAGLAEDIRFNGRVRCLGYDSGPFTVDLWLENPQGQRVAGRQVEYPSLASGLSVTLPQVLFNVDRPGDYCAHMAIIEGRDVNPDNNTDESCFPVASGPFVVSPNVATPNGDGHNDEIVFRFQNQTMENPKIRIFELSGHLVYESDSFNSQRSLTWDGRNQSGDPMPPGTYLYVVYDNGREFRTGTCGVIR